MSPSKTQSLASYGLGQQNDESPCALLRSRNRLKTYYGICGVIPQQHESRQTACLSHMGLVDGDTYLYSKFRKIILDNGFGGRGSTEAVDNLSAGLWITLLNSQTSRIWSELIQSRTVRVLQQYHGISLTIWNSDNWLFANYEED
jgi:hypothetical protein